MVEVLEESNGWYKIDSGYISAEYAVIVDAASATLGSEIANYALTFVGYTDALGEAYSHLETNAYTGKIEDYQRVQYDRLFDGGAAAALYQG